MTTFSLSWNTYKQNICSGLSSLQQNGEFVDMTLAADGHHVKVHQLVMSLISPYIKELISSIQCPHPVIFLNNISYTILCSILEYIYTGEVLVSQENLQELINAAKQLHIKGLMDMTIELATTDASKLPKQTTVQPLPNTAVSIDSPNISTINDQDHEYQLDSTHRDDDFDADDDMPDWNSANNKPSFTDMAVSIKGNEAKSNTITSKDTQIHPEARMQYTLSNQGSLQIILNRYVYCMRYMRKRRAGGHAGPQLWRCTEYSRRRKCPAALVSQDDVVIKRYGVHNHPFHDKKILKKVRDKIVFATLGDAEKQGTLLKQIRAANQGTHLIENVLVDGVEKS